MRALALVLFVTSCSQPDPASAIPWEAIRPEEWFTWMDGLTPSESVDIAVDHVSSELRPGPIEREERSDAVRTSVVLRAPARFVPALLPEDEPPRRVEAFRARIVRPDRGDCHVFLGTGFEGEDLRVKVYGYDAGDSTACADFVRRVADEGIEYVLGGATWTSPRRTNIGVRIE